MRAEQEEVRGTQRQLSENICSEDADQEAKKCPSSELIFYKLLW